MSRVLLFCLLLLGVVAVAIIFMPLRLAVTMAGIENSNFSARQITGSIWNGRIEDASLGPIELGDLDAAMQFFPLLTGDTRINIDRGAGDLKNGLSATIGKSGNIFLIEDATTTFRAARQLAPLPASDIELDGVNVAFAGGRCLSAKGQVRVSLDANIPGLDLQRGLLGNAECQDGSLVLPLVSGSGMEQLTFKMDGNGSYSARLSLSGNNSTWAVFLPTMGFRQTPEGYAIKMTGQLGQMLTE